MDNECIQSEEPVEIPIGPLARAYLIAIREGQVTEDSPARQLQDAAAYICRWGVSGCTADVLRVVAALAEVTAELKEQDDREQAISQAHGGMVQR